jgi:hypothetical protein
MGAGLVGCGSSEEPSTAEPPVTGTGEKLEIFFPKLNSAYISGSDRKFKVPAVVQGVRADKWTCSDKDAVDFEVDGVANGVMITTRKAGTFTITATAGKRVGTAPLVVTAATEEDWTRGKDRYNNAIPLMLTPQMLQGGFMLMQNLACTNCHGSGAMFLAVEHTPQQTGGYTDDEIKNIFMNGTKPPGASYGSLPGIERFYPMFHKWTADEAEYKGLVVYLRSLEPKTQGALDFMGLVNSLRGARGMMGAAAGSAAPPPAGTAGAAP